VQHQIRHSHPGGQLDQRKQVLEARVHAAVRHQAQQVHSFGPGERLLEDRVRGELAGLGCPVEPGQVLHHDRAGPEIEMPNLRVAHLAFRQPDGASASGQCGVRITRPQLIEHRRGRQ
jgi:hypothetical protein